MPQSPPILEAQGLRKSFGPVRALRGVDLSIAPGELVALFGPNGAGKTTLIRCLASLARPEAGRVLVGGDDLSGPAAGRARARMGLVTHQTLLYDSLTAEENLVFYASLYGAASPLERARGLLEEFGLGARARDTVRGYSRGMQQRVALARALVHEPDILLLDEPATGLDPAARAALTRRLGGFRQAGRSALIVSHDVASTLALTDRYLVIAGGRIVGSGPAAAADPLRLQRDYFPASPSPEAQLA